MKKFAFGEKNTKKLIRRILELADLYEPTGSLKVIRNHHFDNLILETAILGRAKYLVTGDKEHLLPLKMYKYVKIVDAEHFISLQSG